MQLDVCYVANFDPAKYNGGADIEPFDGLFKKHHKLGSFPKKFAGTEYKHSRYNQGQGPENKGADECLTPFPTHVSPLE
jgi:hypothetical protein